MYFCIISYAFCVLTAQVEISRCTVSTGMMSSGYSLIEKCGSDGLDSMAKEGNNNRILILSSSDQDTSENEEDFYGHSTHKNEDGRNADEGDQSVPSLVESNENDVSDVVYCRDPEKLNIHTAATPTTVQKIPSSSENGLQFSSDEASIEDKPSIKNLNTVSSDTTLNIDEIPTSSDGVEAIDEFLLLSQKSIDTFELSQSSSESDNSDTRHLNSCSSQRADQEVPNYEE